MKDKVESVAGTRGRKLVPLVYCTSRIQFRDGNSGWCTDTIGHDGYHHARIQFKGILGSVYWFAN